MANTCVNIEMIKKRKLFYPVIISESEDKERQKEDVYKFSFWGLFYPIKEVYQYFGNHLRIWWGEIKQKVELEGVSKDYKKVYTLTEKGIVELKDFPNLGEIGLHINSYKLIKPKK